MSRCLLTSSTAVRTHSPPIQSGSPVSSLGLQLQSDIVCRDPHLCHVYAGRADSFDPKVRTNPGDLPPRGLVSGSCVLNNPDRIWAVTGRSRLIVAVFG